MSTQPSVTMQKPLYGFRFVQTQRGDSLQIIAARELGDATLWQQLIDYNGLLPPYITDDPAQADPGVILTGASIKVPAPAPVTTETTDPDALFGTDVQLVNGRLSFANGDIATVSGRDNLKQALTNRIDTPRGDLLMHSDYGSLHQRMKGAGNGPTTGLLVAQYAKASVQSDPRIQSIMSATSTVNGDAIEVSIEARPISGAPVQVGTTI
jgi:phage baseplate assembly protein W